MNGTIASVLVALILVLAAIGVITGSQGDEGPQRRVPPTVEQLAEQVERLRELEFDGLPRVETTTRGEAERYGLRMLDRELPAQRLRAGEQALEMLGLLRPADDLRRVYREVMGNEVAGFYDPDRDRLVLVGGESSRGALRDVVLSHELVHALEDQHFDLRSVDEPRIIDDRQLAEAAIVEGTATVVMADYLLQSKADLLKPSLRERGALLDDFAGLAAGAGTGELPRYVDESLLFPYIAGARFVDGLERRGGWSAVNRAADDAGPVSSEQVMHPEKFRHREAPRHPSLASFARLLPATARRVTSGTLGEFDTVQMLVIAGDRERAERAGAGWGGGRFELWRWRQGAALVAAWTWDSERDAAEFEAAAREWLKTRPWAGAVRRSGDTVAAALAPRSVPVGRVAAAAVG